MLDTKLKDDKKARKKQQLREKLLLIRHKFRPLSPYAVMILIISFLLLWMYNSEYEGLNARANHPRRSVSTQTKYNNDMWRGKSANEISTQIYKDTEYLNAFDTLTQGQLNNISSKFLTKDDTKFLVYNRKSKKIITNIDKILEPLVSNSESKNIDDVLDKIDGMSYISENTTEEKLKSLVKYYNNNDENTIFCLTSTASPAVQYFNDHLKYLKNPQDYLEIFYPTDEGRRLYSYTTQDVTYDNISWADMSTVYNKIMNLRFVIFLCIVTILIAGIKNSLEEFKKSIFVIWAKKIKNGTIEFFEVKDLAYKYVGFLVFSIAAVISAFFVIVVIHDSDGLIWGMICSVIPAIYVFYILPKTFKFIVNLNNIVKGSERIVSGDLNYSIDEEKLDGNLYKLASGINTIKKGFKVSIDEQVKNEKLKSELVANVSHDLKTPLTSIINYTDILMREGLTEEEKQEYIEILNRKSLKLKALIEALFEVSKINSGKIDIEREEVNIIELLKQSIGEFAISAEERGLKFKLNTFSNEVIMLLDGKKMARVFENLISNAIKYSMENTRVFVEVEQREQGIRIWFKNISSYDMDFDINEIFERFSRADKSRTSDIEGNGLGLAIAKSIVELHEGNMSIEKDGDMFKVYMDLN